MRNPFNTPLVSVFRNEVLLNSKRVAPYVLMILFAGNALLWWFRGPAIALGWATNSDFYIARNLKAFSFLMGAPLLTAVIMGDPVIRDFRLGIDPLIFSKPINRVQYLFGKFSGNFVVLVCCMAVFPLTQLLLQAFHPSRMIVQRAQVAPFVRHFFFFVVITHFTLAAIYFTVGALTRNSKIVYGLAICFYPIYISWMFVLGANLPERWKIFLDAFLLNSGPSRNGFGNSADFLNSYVYVYTPDMISNRVLLILVASVCLTVAYFRFRTAERQEGAGNSVLNLSTGCSATYYPYLLDDPERLASQGGIICSRVAIPDVVRKNDSIRANVNKLIGALGIEFRLLAAERSLVVVMPLAILLSILEVAFYNIPQEISHSVAYASNTAKLLPLFLIGIAVFYTGEAIHRDREMRIESVIWSTPVKNNALLCSKWLATILLTFFLLVAVGLLAILIQFMKSQRPVDVSAYVMVYGVVVVPGIVVITSFVVALNVLLRNKYVAYVIAISTGAGLFYLYNVGYNHWLYNPLLYQLWKYEELASAKTLATRLYWLGAAVVCLAFSDVAYQRKSTRRGVRY